MPRFLIWGFSTLIACSCIALSGLASHPFGSWQPKGDDKTFMWIRDNLPKHLHCVRCIIYGYSTKLHDSQSFQSIQDLAHKLIDQLLAYGWGAPSGKPIAFLAHSLGGLVLKDALVQLNSSQDQAYKTLLGIIQGGIFFGVPNLGMEQAHFRTIVQSNPNEALVDDIARNSNYLRRLNEAFTQADFDTKLRCFWAFETSESPTVSVCAYPQFYFNTVLTGNRGLKTGRSIRTDQEPYSLVENLQPAGSSIETGRSLFR